jgi:hypothetical protein
MIIRRVRRHGLITLYRHGDVLVRSLVHCILGLPLCPPRYIAGLWNDFLRNAPVHADAAVQASLQRLCDYVHRTHMATPARRARINAFDTPVLMPRTNNGSESHNSSLNKDTAGSHGKIEGLLNTLKQRNHIAAIRNVQLEALQPPRRRLVRYNVLDVRIREACVNIAAVVAQLLAGMRDMDVGEQRAQQNEVHILLARHCRRMARLLGGAVHAELIGHAPAGDIAPLVDGEAGQVQHVNEVAEVPFDQFDQVEEDDEEEIV